MAAALALPAAQAFDVPTPNPDLKVRLDLTPKYSAGYRLKNPSPLLTQPDQANDPGVVNEDDGDHNFNRGLISSRFDLLGELDVTAKHFGARLSGVAWRDSMYLRSNDYTVPPGGTSTSNNFSDQASNEFLPATRRQHGRGSELLDAFAHVKGELGDMSGTLRLGKHTLQWGESLFFGQNGIANAQGPVDVAKIVSVPDWQFKEVLLPVEQVSGSLQVAEGVSLGAYYQFKWRPSKIPGVGSYFSNQDYIGAARVYAGPAVLNYEPSRDLKPKDSGQGGLQLRWTPENSDYEFGFYAANYHEHAPSALVFDFATNTTYVQYAEDVHTIGASVTSSIDQLNWAVEGSVRWNAPLTSDPAVLGAGPILTCGTNDDNPCYAVGRTAHLQMSGVYLLQQGTFWNGGALVGELAWNRRLKITRDIFALGPGGSNVGLGGLDPHTTKDAFALRFIFEPQYFQVMPGLDMSVPIAVGYNFGGRSSAVSNFAGGSADAGDYSLGLKVKYRNAWNAALTYKNYFGKETTFTETLVPGSATPRQLSYAQSLKDRGYVAFSLSRTF